MSTISNKYALVTGGTSGIGYELARLLAKDGYNLVIVARTESDLERVSNEFSVTYGVNVISLSKDLFEADAAFEVYEECKSRDIIVDILVNDAGQGVYGPFAESNLLQQLQIIQLNIASLTTLTYLFLQ